ncbi:hypothetical protein AAG570_009252 [Ranatra chinensis]|uniref:Uncharacterized protein n=1 Tax=Ranatra chinensis TaxID=642074 RepID=A0ABD0ZEF3_9HEMI
MVTPTPEKLLEADLVFLDGAIRLMLIDWLTRFAYKYPLQAKTGKRVREGLLLFEVARDIEQLHGTLQEHLHILRIGRGMTGLVIVHFLPKDTCSRVLVQIVQNAIEHPSPQMQELEKKLENDVSELSFLMKEIKAVLVHIKQLRNQRAKVRKETKVTRKYLHKQKRQEIHEMELVVAVYDKDLLRKWQVAKKSSQQATIESFLNDALGKKEAVSYICRMAGERLQTLRNIERERRSTKILQSLFTNQTTTNQGTSNEIVAADDYSLF